MILEQQRPKYDFQLHYLSADDLKYYWFSTGDSFCKAILCLFAYFQPKSFHHNGIVTLDNSWLKISNSRNYHHFFPRSYLGKKNIDYANSIVNITLVDDYLNKREIRAQAPSKYMKKFAKQNQELQESMKSHLIDDLDGYGIWEDDYDTYLEKRAERILEELLKRIHE